MVDEGAGGVLRSRRVSRADSARVAPILILFQDHLPRHLQQQRMILQRTLPVPLCIQKLLILKAYGPDTPIGPRAKVERFGGVTSELAKAAYRQFPMSSSLWMRQRAPTAMQTSAFT